MDKEEIKYCYGCGLPLQSSNPNGKGFLPQEVLENSKENKLCQRCFKIQNYNLDTCDEKFNLDEFKKIISHAHEKKSLIVYIIDLFSLETSFLNEIIDLLKSNNILIVANKRDLLPKSIDENKILNYIKKSADNLRLNYKDVIIVSAKKNYNIDKLISTIMSFRNCGDVYFIGSASCGKSSIINALLKNYSNETSHFITTSPYPGTTMDVIEIPIDDKSYIYDTPGLSVESSMLSIMEPKIVNLITPKKEIKPITFQLNNKQGLIIGGLSYLIFEEGKRTNFTIYIYSMVNIIRTKSINTVSSFNSLIKNKGIIPVSHKINSSTDLEEHVFKCPTKGKCDLNIFGYCWISFEGEGQIIKISAPKNIKVTLKQAII